MYLKNDFVYDEFVIKKLNTKFYLNFVCVNEKIAQQK